MKPTKYQAMGIPEAYCFEAFVYVPSANIGVCVFTRREEPEVSRIFWRHADHNSYAMIPVQDENHSFDGCTPSASSDSIYYVVMHHRKPQGMKCFGGYWVSLNRFCLMAQKEEVLINESDFAAMTGKEGSWISRIVHVSPSDSEIDVVAGIGHIRDGRRVMEYAIYRIDLAHRQITRRFPMPAVFI